MTNTLPPADAYERYETCNARTLRWMLARGDLNGGFLDTKVNSITLDDYDAKDGIRGPDFTYGWIQGRGLEAIATHAAHFESTDPALSTALDQAGKRLYHRLKSLRAADGHIYFCYDAEISPVRVRDGVVIGPQVRGNDVFTYADTFAAKGLIAAAARYAPDELPTQLDYLKTVIAAIEEGRFQYNEDRPLSTKEAAQQPDDFGPRMIALGACELLERIGQPAAANFGARFVDHVLARHLDPATNLLRNVPGQDACNIGHGIEFTGFALARMATGADPALVRQLTKTLKASFQAGFQGPGIALSVSTDTGQVLNAKFPWWSLPETIRAVAQAQRLLSHMDAELLDIWAKADHAFFAHYWRADASLAYQTRDETGPLDFVPATPDLDPGYHTGLSLLGAMESLRALTQTNEVAHG